MITSRLIGMTEFVSETSGFVALGLPLLSCFPPLNLTVCSSFEEFAPYVGANSATDSAETFFRLNHSYRPNSNEVKVSIHLPAEYFTPDWGVIITSFYSYSTLNQMRDYPLYIKSSNSLLFYHRLTNNSLGYTAQHASTQNFKFRAAQSRRNRAEKLLLSAIVPLLRGLADQKGVWVEFGSSLSRPIHVTFQDSHDATWQREWFSVSLSPLAAKELLQGFQQRAIREFVEQTLAASEII